MRHVHCGPLSFTCYVSGAIVSDIVFTSKNLLTCYEKPIKPLRVAGAGKADDGYEGYGSVYSDC